MMKGMILYGIGIVNEARQYCDITILQVTRRIMAKRTMRNGVTEVKPLSDVIITSLD